MRINFAMYGIGFDAIEFLSEAEQIPPRYYLWQDLPEMEDPNGMTLRFDNDGDFMPNEMIRFLLANGDLLMSGKYNAPDIIKEVCIIIEDKDVMHTERPPGYIHCIKPGMLGMVAAANIHFYVSRAFEVSKNDLP